MHYRIILTPLTDADGGGWWAEIPELPGCCSDGETPEEAARSIQVAQKLWMKIQRGRGKTAPEPKGYEI